ncbi:protein APCDD1-like [Daphnia pulex]|uniref:protein APCDD1-like n=1 Tax=Daphnia pulex TaxID=6669 RepID=UPI001EDE9A53|nr:protein APCDD1-like [Daphnia pulex]
MNGRSLRLVALMVTVAMATTSADSSNRQTHRGNRLGDTNDPSILMNNLLLELDESLPECSSAFRRVQHGERSAHASYPPDIKGLWVSQECETRPGPEFVLRQYQFERDGSFKLLQHFYGDEWCTTPVYTLTAKGQLQMREPSWVVPGAAESEYTLHRVHLVAYSEDVVDEVMQRVNRSCPGYINRPWRVRKEYLIYNYGPAAAGDGKSAEPFNKPASVRSSSSDRHWMTASNGKRHNGSGRGNNNNKMGADQRSKRVSHNGSHHSASTGGDFATPSDTSVALDEIDCLAAFHAVYHELQLIRTVRRPRDLLAESPQQSKSSSSGSGNKKKNFHHPVVDAQPMQTLLFLGNIHSQLEQRASYRPTSYQPALIRHDHQESNDCHVCRLVAKSTDKSPPHLHARPRLPVYPMGDWISSSCETRPIGTFLMRRMKFTDHQNGLNAGKYSASGALSPTFQALFHYFADPVCSNATLTVLATGHYSPGSDSDRVQGATEFDFFVQSVIITVHDESTARNLNGLKGNQCAMDGSWRVDRPQDVTHTGGCIGLGIRVPTVANDLLKMDVNGIGHPLLYFGIADNPSEPRTSKSSELDLIRPTSYLPPLQQCQSIWEDLSSVNEASNELGPIIPHARVSGESSRSSSLASFTSSCSFAALILANAIYRLF